MRKYANEAAFSKHLCAHLTELGYFVQRIETKLTGRGVPDLYVGTPGHPGRQYWIELKRRKCNKPTEGGFLVKWRPGQQRWLYRHYKLTQMPCFTFVAFNDCIAAIANTRIFPNGIAHPHEIMKIWYKVEDVRL